MSTPKELADKAKRYARYARHGSATYEAKTLLELNATIDQLQAMAEARQGSGEPVTAGLTDGTDRYAVTKGSYWWHVRIGDGQQLIGKCHTKGSAEELAAHLVRAYRDGYFSVLYAAPPPAGNRTHIADLIDTFEQLRKIVGTPEQDADALIAAVRTLAAPPSAVPAERKTIEQMRPDFEWWWTTRGVFPPIGSPECEAAFSAWIASGGYTAPGGWRVSPRPWGYEAALAARSTQPSAQQATDWQEERAVLIREAHDNKLRAREFEADAMEFRRLKVEQQATGKFFNRLQEIKATPEGREMLRQAMQEGEDCATATGSGQVLTDVQRQAVEEAAGYFSRSWKSEDAKLANKLRTILAAAEAITEEEYDAECSDAPTTGKREPLPSAETLLTWAVEDGVIRLSQMMNADLQDALVNFAARITGEQR